VNELVVPIVVLGKGEGERHRNEALETRGLREKLIPLTVENGYVFLERAG
jgi:hypothetical protein